MASGGGGNRGDRGGPPPPMYMGPPMYRPMPYGMFFYCKHRVCTKFVAVDALLE